MNYQCDHEFVKVTSVPTECFRGDLLPKKPACRRGKAYICVSIVSLSTLIRQQNDDNIHYASKFTNQIQIYTWPEAILWDQPNSALWICYPAFGDRADRRRVFKARWCSEMANRYRIRNEGKKKKKIGNSTLVSGDCDGKFARKRPVIINIFLSSFPDGTEVTFHCIDNVIGEKLTWRIICADGSWIGRSLSCGS